MVLGAYQYDYDEATGLPSNRRLFARSPFEARSDRRMSGRFDGICVDAEGNVWAAELGESAIVGWRPNGEVICAVRVPRCTTTTICCFGGGQNRPSYHVSSMSVVFRAGYC
jgi:sugar lactone lactonase YvrE